MTEAISIAMYADLACLFAYVSAYRLRKLRDASCGSITIEHKSLSLEYVNREPTPKSLLERELSILISEEPGLPYQRGPRPESEWPVTMWPAFEAVKCAERQGLELADEYDWALRTALLAESRCISMRHVLFDLAEHVGVEMGRFADDARPRCDEVPGTCRGARGMGTPTRRGQPHLCFAFWQTDQQRGITRHRS